ncbi:MAG: ATP phosphoribosyltransferase regulatory subunit [Bacillota bacterium]|nr:ATP phosphoribosyltransferase regulatory subunit [Bacillota bacterium]
MSRFNTQIPDGTRDLLFASCSAKNKVSEDIKVFFEDMGYSEVKTPSVEFYDVFTSNSDPLPQEEMFKMTDAKGRLLVLRPDCTQPIARVVATRFKDPVLPIKLHYTQNVFSVSGLQNGKRTETTQSGVELIGAAGLLPDIDIIMTAAQMLKQFGVDFNIEIGNVGLFKEIISGLNIDEESAETIRALIERKNFASLNDILDGLSQSEGDKQILKRLPELFGGEEVFAECASLTDNPAVLEKLSYLETIYRRLVDLGLKNYVSIDLGLVHHINYYTGIVFRGYIDGVGGNVISGGRYDDLIQSFGMSLPATGFAVNIDALADLLSKRQDFAANPVIDAIVFCGDGNFNQAYELLENLRKQGSKAELSVMPTLEETIAYAKCKKIKKLFETGETVTVMEVEAQK